MDVRRVHNFPIHLPIGRVFRPPAKEGGILRRVKTSSSGNVPSATIRTKRIKKWVLV